MKCPNCGHDMMYLDSRDIVSQRVQCTSGKCLNIYHLSYVRGYSDGASKEVAAIKLLQTFRDKWAACPGCHRISPNDITLIDEILHPKKEVKDE